MCCIHLHRPFTLLDMTLDVTVYKDEDRFLGIISVRSYMWTTRLPILYCIFPHYTHIILDVKKLSITANGYIWIIRYDQLYSHSIRRFFLQDNSIKSTSREALNWIWMLLTHKSALIIKVRNTIAFGQLGDEIAIRRAVISKPQTTPL